MFGHMIACTPEAARAEAEQRRREIEREQLVGLARRLAKRDRR